MIAELVVALSLVGLGSSVAERRMSNQQKERIQAGRHQLEAWIGKARTINFSQRIRQRPVIVAMSVLPIVFLGSIIWLFPRAAVAAIGLLLGLSVICAALLWWLSRSSDDRIFVFRFALIASVAFVIYQATMYWLVRDIEGVNELLLYGPLVVAFKIFFLLVFGFVFFLAFIPFVAARLVAWFLRGADLFLRHCIDNNRPVFMALCAIAGGLAAAYIVVTRSWA